MSRQEHATDENAGEQEHEIGRNTVGHDHRTRRHAVEQERESSDSDEYDIIDDETSSTSSGDSEDAAGSLEVDTMKDARRLLVFTSQQQDLMTLFYN